MNPALLMSAAIGLVVAFGGASPPPVSTGATMPSTAPALTGAASIHPVSKSLKRQWHRAAKTANRSASPAVRDVAAADQAALREPVAQSFIDAVQVYPYAEGALYHVYTAPGRITDIALQTGETLNAVAAGDTARWVIGDTSSGSADTKRTHILVKPFTAGLSTSLVISTDRRIYHVALSSTPATAMAALSWTYPQDELIALRRAAEKAEAAAPVAAGIDIEQLHFNYTVSGDTPGWRPLRVFDDGLQTFIEFPPSLSTGDAPPLFVVGAKGEAELVNYRVRGRYYVVDRLFDTAELRLGLKHQLVVRISRTIGTSGSRRGA